MALLKAPVTSEDFIQGNGTVTLVEYGDYQCPFCGKAYPLVKQLQKHFRGQLRLVFRNFPLTQVHPYAEAAAETAMFAGKHDLFWKMHDLLFENQEDLSLPMLVDLTEALGLSGKELEKVISEKRFEAKIQEDFLGGVRSGVNGTPTFFINDQRYDGPISFESIVSAVDSSTHSQKML